MADVAALAGVSQMTVSRVINGTATVRPATRERVLAAMRSLDYQPNTAARALATGRSSRLGVVSHNATLFGPTSTLHEIERVARSAGYTVSVITADALDTVGIRTAVDALRRQPVDGIVIMTPHRDAVAGVEALDCDVPIVTVHGRTGHGAAAVTIDQRAGARRATNLLLSLGHETIWHIAGPQEWLEAQERAEAWATALRDADRPVPDLLQGDWDARSGYELGRQLLVEHPEVTAVFAANDRLALGLYRAAAELGRRIPEDLSIVGFDDVPEAAYYAPPLTTIRQDFGQVGKLSIALLLDEVDNGGATVRYPVVDADVVLRDSTAPPPG
ncbi:LacI family DNA-binding transcriptional regulator [Euzebya sp.]|uniref:LacI family DNA-binding transcriptional regulator n=1 Tax=Euzebya sp. TaxID=1971409 RepID=UPI00351968F2